MITATFQRLQNRFDNTGWSVLRFANVEEGSFMAVGVVSDVNRLCEGMQYQIDGQWKTHQKYGRQYAFSSLRQQKPMSRDQVVAYLCKYANGIGLTTAERIYDQFGYDSIEMIKNAPEEVARSVKRVRLADLQKISAALKAREGTEAVYAELMEMFSGLRISQTTMQCCLKVWGLNAPDKIREDAFCMLDPRIERCGFPTADKVFLKLGGQPDDYRRMLRCFQYVIDSQSSGSTWMNKSEVETEFIRYLIKNGNVAVADAAKAFPRIVSDCERIDYVVLKNDLIASCCDDEMEEFVSAQTKRFFKSKKLRTIYVPATQDGAVLNRRKFR